MVDIAKKARKDDVPWIIVGSGVLIVVAAITYVVVVQPVLTIERDSNTWSAGLGNFIQDIGNMFKGL